MGKVVKTVAKVAVPAAIGFAAYQTGGFGMGQPGFQTSGFWKGTSSFGGGSFLGGIGSALSKNPFTAAGLVTQGYSSIQSQKYASQQSGYQRQQVEARNAADAQRNKYNQLQNKRQRLAAIRQARIQQAAISGSMGNVLGQGGTSGYVGALGSLGSQASGNIGNVNVAEGYGNEISRLNTMSANYGSQANTAASKSSMWSDVNVLGSTLFTDSDKISNLTNKIFT